MSVDFHSLHGIIHGGDGQVGEEHVVGQHRPLDSPVMRVSIDLMQWGEVHLGGQAPGPL